MTQDARRAYFLPSMEGSQYKLAFVIQLRPETNVEEKRFAGRVEHISSHEASHFQSLDQLLEFIERMLRDEDSNRGE